MSPPTLTENETRAILHATSGNARDHLIHSLALGTGLRLAEIVGLNLGDVYFPDGRPRSRIRIRAEIVKDSRWWRHPFPGRQVFERGDLSLPPRHPSSEIGSVRLLPARILGR